MRFERDGAGLEIHPIHVEDRAIAEVERDQERFRMLRVGQDILRAHASERSEIAHVATRQVGGKKVVDFVAVIVVEIKDMFPVQLPTCNNAWDSLVHS